VHQAQLWLAYALRGCFSIRESFPEGVGYAVHAVARVGDSDPDSPQFFLKIRQALRISSDPAQDVAPGRAYGSADEVQNRGWFVKVNNDAFVFRFRISSKA
jgi:hypothetical protein